MAKKLHIDFSGVPKEIRKGGGKKLPEADYAWKIVSSEIGKKEGATSRYIRWQLSVAKGQFKGVTRSYITSLKPEALFNLRNLIHAATGKNVAGKAMDFDREKLYGKIVGGSISNEERDNKTFNDLVAVFPVDELSDEEEEEDEDEEEVEEEEDDEDLEEVDVDEL